MRRRTGWTWLMGAALAAGTLSVMGAVGCVGGSKGLTSADQDRLKPYILDSAPADLQHKVDVNFENKIHLVGYKFDPETAKPGQDVKITMYWRCDDALDDGWSLFTHLHDEQDRRQQRPPEFQFRRIVDRNADRVDRFAGPAATKPRALSGLIQ